MATATSVHNRFVCHRMIPPTQSREWLPFPAKFRAPCTSLDRWTIRTIRSYGSGWGPDGVASPATRSGETRAARPQTPVGTMAAGAAGALEKDKCCLVRKVSLGSRSSVAPLARVRFQTHFRDCRCKRPTGEQLIYQCIIRCERGHKFHAERARSLRVLILREGTERTRLCGLRHL
jgi:hypothetical protein